jgi:hypothetical protein
MAGRGRIGFGNQMDRFTLPQMQLFLLFKHCIIRI